MTAAQPIAATARSELIGAPSGVLNGSGLYFVMVTTGSDRPGWCSGSSPSRWQLDSPRQAAKPINHPHWPPGAAPGSPEVTAKRAYPRGGPQRWAMDAAGQGRVTASMGHRSCGNDICGPSLRLPGPAEQHRWPIVAVCGRGRGRRRIARFTEPGPGRPEPGPPLPNRGSRSPRLTDLAAASPASC